MFEPTSTWPNLTFSQCLLCGQKANYKWRSYQADMKASCSGTRWRNDERTTGLWGVDATTWVHIGIHGAWRAACVTPGHPGGNNTGREWTTHHQQSTRFDRSSWRHYIECSLGMRIWIFELAVLLLGTVYDQLQCVQKVFGTFYKKCDLTNFNYMCLCCCNLTCWHDFGVLLDRYISFSTKQLLWCFINYADLYI